MTAPLSYPNKKLLRRLEILESLRILHLRPPMNLTVEIRRDRPRAFTLRPGFLRLGVDWLEDPVQLRRALVMGVLKTRFGEALPSSFQLEVLTDFLLLTVFDQEEWNGATSDQRFSMKDLVRLPSSSPSFGTYCQSPFRSLAHWSACQLPRPGKWDQEAGMWGLRPLMALALWRVVDQLSLMDQMHLVETLRKTPSLPPLKAVREANVGRLVEWFRSTLTDHLKALGFSPKSSEVHAAMERALKELQVESPTRWELTVDLTHTPAWRKILEQLKTRSRFRSHERTLVFTPQGGIMLPSGLPVSWSASDIQSQTHVLIACKWPAPDQAVSVRSRHIFARQTCDPLTQSFWDSPAQAHIE